MTIVETHQAIADRCAEIARLFKPGARVTVLVRNPGFGKEDPHSADMLVGDDDCAAVIESVQYLQSREEKTLA